MPDAARQRGRRALDFVDAVERFSAPDVVKRFESEIQACGFHAYIMAGPPTPGTVLPELRGRQWLADGMVRALHTRKLQRPGSGPTLANGADADLAGPS